ncbi:peptidylprolyl isomerase [Streptomyces oryzae]|uniref:Peptidyl-prolyl cis-trans isomerase n=1 Tax=Streptomyces oryzae TaxID=1434886 RepID=A0ABS3XHL2_9ACTN|nr:peptidylprolyl isomerase [Streptomyces oryzae]MBO8194900.1 peptidylprolyl isomerase [Streptomyces oryzae]
MVSSEQRRKQLARQKYERQLKRREAARRRARIRNISIALGLVIVLAAGGAYAASGGLNGDKKKDDAEKAADQPSAPPTSKAPDPCEKPAKGKPTGKQWKKEPAMKVDKSASYTMQLSTSCGEIDFTMDAAKAPHTVNSFNFLAGEKFFDHTPCHRMTQQPGLNVLQCGDPTGSGSGGPGYELPDENLKGAKYPAGTVAMANSGPDTAGSQFFLVYKDSKLPPKYTPFGKVSASGMKVLKKITKAGLTPMQAPGDGRPNATVVIDKATVRKS